MSLAFKKRLIADLEGAIQQQLALKISWHCSFCQKNHVLNFLENVIAVVSEGENIVLYDEDGLMTVIIGISKNKRLQKDYADQYVKLGAAYLQVSPVMGENVTIVDNLQNQTFVSYCLNPRCGECGHFQSEKNLIIVDSDCWKCGAPMKVAVIECGDGHMLGPDQFSEAELELAKINGVLIQNNYSNTVGHEYLSNTCPHCGLLTGGFYLFQNHYHPAMMGDLAYESIMLGYHCSNCE